jgi:hypothetical protein
MVAARLTNARERASMKVCVTVEGSPRVNALPSFSSLTWPEMSHKSNPVSLLPHHVVCQRCEKILDLSCCVFGEVSIVYRKPLVIKYYHI